MQRNDTPPLNDRTAAEAVHNVIERIIPGVITLRLGQLGIEASMPPAGIARSTARAIGMLLGSGAAQVETMTPEGAAKTREIYAGHVDNPAGLKASKRLNEATFDEVVEEMRAAYNDMREHTARKGRP